MSTQAPEIFDAARFRHVMGHYPTGVTIITACLGGRPGGMTVGSYTSVSLDPPLVGFFPEKSSTTFPHIREAGSFCVNILGADQEPTCRAFARKGQNRFDGVGWRPADSGSPILADVIAWIDCDIESVTGAGDHYLVLGRVRALDVSGAYLPLMFFCGGFGKYEPLSLVAADEPDLVRLIRCSGLARPHLEELAAEVAAECTVSARVGNDLVVLASAGSAGSQGGPPAVGRRIPMLPPLGSQFVAWEPDEQVDGWLARSPLPIGRSAGKPAMRRWHASGSRAGWPIAPISASATSTGSTGSPSTPSATRRAQPTTPPSSGWWPTLTRLPGSPRYATECLPAPRGSPLCSAPTCRRRHGPDCAVPKPPRRSDQKMSEVEADNKKLVDAAQFDRLCDFLASHCDAVSVLGAEVSEYRMLPDHTRHELLVRMVAGPAAVLHHQRAGQHLQLRPARPARHHHRPRRHHPAIQRLRRVRQPHLRHPGQRQQRGHHQLQL